MTSTLSVEATGWLINLTAQQFKQGKLPANLRKLARYAFVESKKYRKFCKVYEEEISRFVEPINDDFIQIEFVSHIISCRKKYTKQNQKYGQIGRIFRAGYVYEGFELFKDKIKTELLKMKEDELNEIVRDEASIKQYLENRLQGMLHLYNINTNIQKNKINIISDDTVSSSNQSPITDSHDTIHSSSQSSTSIPPSPHHSHTSVDINPSYSDKFNTWLHEYGNTINTDKAYRIWQKLTPQVHMQIMTHTKQFIKIRELEYRPSAYNYLNDRIYLDDLRQLIEQKKSSDGKMMPEDLKKNLGI